MFVRVLTGLLFFGGGLAFFGYVCYKAGQMRERERRERWAPIFQAVMDWRRFEREGHELQAGEALGDLRIRADQEFSRLERELGKLID